MIDSSQIVFTGGIAQYLSGSGTWSSSTAIQISGGSSVTPNNSMTWDVSSIQLNSGSSIYLDPAYVLTLTHPGIAIGLHDANTKIYGNGTLDLASNGSVQVDTGAITARVIVDGWTVHASTTNGGSVSQMDVTEGGALMIDSGNRLAVTGSLSIEHTNPGSGLGGQGTLDMQGPLLSNDGEITVLQVELDSANVILTGRGDWNPNTIYIYGGKKATLGDDIIWTPLDVQVLAGATLDLGTHSLNLQNSSGPSLLMVGVSPKITGSGTLFVQGNATLSLGGGTISAPLDLPSETITITAAASSSLGNLTVDKATLTISSGSTLPVKGTLSLTDASSKITGSGALNFSGTTFATSGFGTVDVDSFTFNGTTQTVSGTGARLGKTGKPVVIASPAEVTFSNTNLCVYSLAVNSGASLAVNQSALTLWDGGTPLAVSGSFSESSPLGYVVFAGSTAQSVGGINFTQVDFKNTAGVTISGPFRCRIGSSWTAAPCTSTII